jgi:hypothetical protein
MFHLENRVCLSQCVQVAGATWRAVTRIMVGVGDLVQRTGDGHTAIKRPGDAVCGLHHAREDEERKFLG